MLQRLHVGLIGSGFMGRSHALAWRMAPAVFGLPLEPRLEMLADIDAPTAARAAQSLGFARSTGDWRVLVADPEVDLVDITAPNVWHAPMALAAIAAGKPVYCEKPLAPSARQAGELADAAERAGVPTMVGFNYLKNPMVQLAKEIVASGEIGEVWSFRGIHAEDYMTDPANPWTWRLDPAGGGGAVADLCSHIVSIARFICGPIASLCADLDTVVTQRPARLGGPPETTVEVDDQVRALVRFASGPKGVLEASWVATGRKMYLAFEIYGSKGSILVDHERLNELQLYIREEVTGERRGHGAYESKNGYRRILAGPAHPDYAGFNPASGHQLGFNEIKTIEVRHLVDALLAGKGAFPDFREAAEIAKVIEAMQVSARQRGWVEVASVGG